MRSSAIELGLIEVPPTVPAPDFNRLARVYRWIEWLTFGPFLQRCRCAFLTTFAQHRKALVLGDGDGRFTARLLKANTAIEVDAVDVSDAMLHQLARRSPAHRVCTHVADARAFTPPQGSYDLIATHFFLDCLTGSDIADLVQRVRNQASPGAVWVVSEFAVPSNIYGRTVAEPLIAFLYVAFGLLTNLSVRCLPDHRVALAQSGWSLVQQKKWLGGLLVSELWRLGSEF
jgi:ubiquinone/menaquinone biosynthesis C-methylase UbiE